MKQIGMMVIIGMWTTSMLYADAPVKIAKSVRLLPADERDVSTNLVAYWRFDEGAGKSVADSTGKYTGTFHNASDKLWAKAKSGANFFSFNGKAYVEIARFPFMETGPGRAMTIAAWIRPADGFIVSKNLDENGTNFEFGISVDQGQLTWHGAGAAAGKTFLRLDDGAWHHFAVVLDDDTGTWFVDGAEDGTFRINESNHEQKVPLLIGTCRSKMGATYKGGMRELRIYSGALTSSAIEHLAQTSK